jgi:hypothetical protein
MCNKIDPSTVERAVGYFDKRDDGHPESFEVLVTVCGCGSTYWAKVPNGIVWVEAEEIENRNVDESTANELAQDIAGIGATPAGSR